VNLLDVIFTLILGYCLVRGIFRGLIKELTSIVGVFGAFYFAYRYYPDMADLLGHWLKDADYANILAFIVLFVGVYLVINTIGAIIKYLMNIAYMGWVDRLTGAVFGTIKGLLIVVVMVAAFTAFLPSKTDLLSDSIFVRHLSGVSAVMVRAGSADMKNLFNTHLKELKEQWNRIGK
jgi:membrane protein required for colicin V production